MKDHYLGGRTVRWWQTGLSTMAIQLGAVSFVSASAFVVLKDGGGLKWLAYEFGVPLAPIFVMIVILPQFHRAGVISIYEYISGSVCFGMLTDWAGPRATKIGIITGAMVNVLLFLLQWWWQAISISWLWWNLTGFMSTVIMARVLSGWDKQPGKEVPLEPSRINCLVVYGLAGFYFILIVGLAGLMQNLGQ